jgi:hypothetical protein
MWQMADYGAPGDGTAQFLRELRQLRDAAGLGHAELAARAHFPYDSIRAAEVGPGLPDLPVLCAYVRACGGTTEEWEERWRSLTSSPSLPVSASRNAGRSDAATAGARIGSVSQVGDNPDPSIIIAALSRVAEEMASPAVTTVPPSPDVQSADEFTSADAAFLSSDAAFPPPDPAFPSAAEPFASAAEPFASAAEPVTSDNPPGWDPIRVSTAWPALRDTPMVAAQAADGTEASGSTGMGVPWGTAPWAQGAQDAASSARGRAGSPAQAGRRTASGARGSAAAPAAGSGRSASLTKVVVIAAVLVCVLAVLLAVFA